MPSRQQDWAFFEAGVQELPGYLLSDELFWPLSGPVNLPRLTIGGLLLARARLYGWAAGEDEQSSLQQKAAELEATRQRWRSAWERKAAREVGARFDLWRNYLQEYRAAPAEQADAYPRQVRWRVMLHLLLAELLETPPQAQALSDLDHLLRRHFLPGAFVWESELAAAFPAEPYWYLHGRLRT
ncbi:MAG: hypothetical protein ABWK53_00805 [Anaerolineales bacterium]